MADVQQEARRRCVLGMLSRATASRLPACYSGPKIVEKRTWPRHPRPRSTDPADYQRVPRPVAAMAKDFAAGHHIAPHSHERAQLIFAAPG